MNSRNKTILIVVIIVIVLCCLCTLVGAGAVGLLVISHRSVTTNNPVTSQFALSSGPYDASAVPQADIKTALTAAQKDEKLVLLDFGANWCPDCLVLSKLFEDSSVQPYLQDHFHVVKIDVGYWDKNQDIVKQYGNPIKIGIPAVVVLSPNGDIIASTSDGSLANARTASAQDIMGYLKIWVAKRP
jgi:thiol:disulfide interchange protein